MTKLALGVAATLSSALILIAGCRDGSEEPSSTLTAITSVSPAATAGSLTGNPALDELIDDLEAQNIDALLERVELMPTPCTTSDLQYQPPPCPAGMPDGTEVPAFLTAACEGEYFTTNTEIRRSFEAAFGEAPRSVLYAVGRQALAKNAEQYAVIVMTQGDTRSATAPATLWYATDAGRIIRVQAECAIPGAAQIVEAFGLGATGFIVEPTVTCDQRETDVLIEAVRVSDVDGGRPQVIGYLVEPGAVVTDERAIVTVLNETVLPFRPPRTPAPRLPTWTGEPALLTDIRQGDRLRIGGLQEENCTIEAWKIEKTN